jgi:hypothetical protein
MRIVRRLFCSFALIALLALSARAARDNGRMTVPVMTPITVKLDQALSAKTTVNGEGFTATLKAPVEVDGIVAIPANASAAGLVSKDGSSSQMELNSVFVNGRLYRITTSPIALNQKTNLRTGSTVTFYLVFSLNIAK